MNARNIGNARFTIVVVEARNGILAFAFLSCSHDFFIGNSRKFRSSFAQEMSLSFARLIVIFESA